MKTKQKHIPVRTCVVCREKAGKRTLTRLVLTDQGLLVDTTGKASGRGAYLCDNPDCWERAAKSDVLNNALRTTLSPDDRNRIRLAVV